MKLLRRIAGYKLALYPVHSCKQPLRARLKKILDHANDTSSYYKSAYDQFISTQSDLTDEEFFYAYSHLKITSKSDLEPYNNKLLQNTLNSGSKKIILRDANNDSINYIAQSFIKSFNLIGWKQGESLVIFIQATSPLAKLSNKRYKFLERYFGLTIIPYDEITKQDVEQLFISIKQTKSTLLVTTPAALHKISEVMDEHNAPPFEHLPYINVCGSFFLECSKSYIQTMFPDSDIQSTYSSKIFGNIAHQKSLHGNDYTVLDDYSYLEQGPENTIIITQYNPNSRPLIRYQTGDIGRIINNPDGSQSIKNLEGSHENHVIGADGYAYYPSFFNNFINELNKEFKHPIIHFNLRHFERYDEKYMHVNVILNKINLQPKFKREIQHTLNNIFANFSHIDITFSEKLDLTNQKNSKIVSEDKDLAIVIKQYLQEKAS